MEDGDRQDVETERAPPPGFERHFRRSPLTEPWEPLYSRRDGGQFIIALRVARAHCNARGLLHGGLVSALADNAMGLACVLASDGRAAGAVTANLAVDFFGSAKPGQWLEIAATARKVGTTLAFGSATVTADGEPVAGATTVFRMLAAERKYSE